MITRKSRSAPKKSANLFLIADVLMTVERLRLAGIGLNEALKKTVVEVKALHPNCRISVTAVKNILHEYQPENSFLFEVQQPENWKPGVFRFIKDGDTYSMVFSDRPKYRTRGDQINRKKIEFSKKKR